MVKTVGELLQALMERETQVLAAQNLQHGPTIGTMYEGLTQDLIQRSLPSGGSISVVSGFAIGSNGQQSRQLDCMIVIGPGERIPYTNSFTYPIDQVVAVIEVKKTLYQSEFEDAFRNLQSLRLELTKDRAVWRHLKSAFQLISGRAMPDNPKAITDPFLRQLVHQLLMELTSPAKILLGYEGYKSSRALRDGVVDHLQSLVGRVGGGPSSLPDLILNPKAAVVKANGFPYFTRVRGNRWPLLVSAGSISPAATLLEVLWTRLRMHVGMGPEIFGEDLTLDAMTLLAEYEYIPNKGWEIFAHNTGDENLEPSAQEWHPLVLDDFEADVMVLLGLKDEINIEAPPDGWDAAKLRNALIQLEIEGVVGRDAVRPSVYRQLTEAGCIAFLPDGRTVAGENASGRLARWVSNYQAGRSKSQRQE